MPWSTCACCSSGPVVPLRRLPAYPAYVLLSCNSCQVKFLRADNYESLGDDHYWDEANRRIYAMPSVMREFERKHRRVLRRVRGAPNMRLLDVGSGNGLFVHHARLMGFQAEGIEPGAIGRELARQQFDIESHAGYLTMDSELPRDFGVVTAWDVIEHVADPGEFLRICHAHLAPGGILVLETPDESCLMRRLITWMSRLTGRDLTRNVYYPSHRFYFTRSALRHLLANTGFRDIRTYRYHSMMAKSVEKYRAYRNPSWLKLLAYRTACAVLKWRPFWNKQIVVAVR